MTTATATYDVIKAEVIRKAIEAIAGEMTVTLVRTSGSPVVTDGKDFSTTILDGKGEQLGFSGYVVFHISTSFLGIQAVERRHGGREKLIAGLKPGDAFLMNDPHTAGMIHQGDCGILMPYFYKDKFWGWGHVGEHLLDVGGSAISGFAPEARDVFSEAMRFSGVKVIRNGELEPEWAEFIAQNVRAPEAVLNDLRSMIAAQNTGQQRLTALLDEIGLEEFEHYSEINKAASERLVRQRFANLPNGTYKSTDWVEYDGHGTPELYEITCALEIDGDEATLRFTGHEQVDCFINATTPVMYGQSMTTLMCQLLYDVPVNEGLWRPIHFDLGPTGTIVNAVAPAPTTQGHMETGSRVNKLLCDVLSQAASLSSDPEVRSRAAGQPGNGSVTATLTGISRRTGRPVVVFPMSPPHCMGAGAGSVGDGQDTYGQQCTLGQRVPAVEIEESTSPLRVLWRRILPDSAGAGIHRGGLGAVIALAIDGTDSLTGAAFNSVAEVPARGFGGGLPAGTSDYYLMRNTKMNELLSQGVLPIESNLGGTVQRTPSKVGSVTVRENDVFMFSTSGGGGLGDPLLRPLEAVEQDVIDGYVTPKAARGLYGVIVQDGKLDISASEELRNSIRRKRLGAKPARESVLTPIEIASFASAIGKADDGQWLCRYCDTTLGEGDDFRDLAVVAHQSIYDLFTEYGMRIRDRADANTRVRLSEYYCPSCAYCLTADVAADSVGLDARAIAS